MSGIELLVPTRGRPRNARRLYDSLVETTSNASVMFFVDEDDPFLEAYLDMLPEGRVAIGESNRLGPWLNIASRNTSAQIVGFVGDDVISRTPEWDQIVRKHFVENAIMYPNDGWQGEGLPTSVFMDAGIVRDLGYMVHPLFKHLYIDNHWKRLGEELGTLKYLPEINMEHMHPFAGKAGDDETYQNANSAAQYSADGKAFQMWETFHLPIDLEKLR